jgi:2-polyprenyl-3-methyl-5-hydroxy-6-metoxy-1,4-benzoquinol methylase
MRRVAYRERIYNNYVQAGTRSLAPDTVEGLIQRAPYLHHMIERHFPESRQAVILDLGCGHGASLYFARELGYVNIRGIDGSPEQIAAARKLGIDGLEEGDLASMLAQLSELSHDCIVTFDVIEHFNEDAPIPHAIKSTKRWILWQIIRATLLFYIAVETGETSNQQIFSQNFLTVIMK